MCSFSLEMLENAMVLALKYHMWKSQYENPVAFCSAVRNGERFFNSHKESKVGTS